MARMRNMFARACWRSWSVLLAALMSIAGFSGCCQQQIMPLYGVPAYGMPNPTPDYGSPQTEYREQLYQTRGEAKVSEKVNSQASDGE